MKKLKKEYKYHIVYRITHKYKNRHYIGIHSCNMDPYEVIGKKYRSSSTDEDFMTEQKQLPENFIYQILNIYDTRKKAIINEIYIHNIYDVGKNPNFYNKAKQTSTGFDTTGVKYSDERREQIRLGMLGELNHFYGKQHTEEVKNFLSGLFKSMRGKCEHCGKEGQYHLIEQWHNDNCVHHTDIVIRNKNIEYMKGVSERKSGENNPMFGRHGKDNRKSFKYELYDSNNFLIDTCYGADISDMIKQNECPCSFRYMDGAYNYTGNSPIRYKSKHGWYLKTIKDWWKDEN